MPHCLNCRNDEPDDMLYCTKCGRQLELQAFEHQAGTLPYIPVAATEQLGQFTQPNTVTPAQAPTVVMPGPRRSSGLWLLLLLPLIGLCGIAGVLVKLALYPATDDVPRNASVVANNANEDSAVNTDEIFEGVNDETDNIMANFNAMLKQIQDESNRNIKKAKMIGHEKQPNDRKN